MLYQIHLVHEDKTIEFCVSSTDNEKQHLWEWARLLINKRPNQELLIEFNEIVKQQQLLPE